MGRSILLTGFCHTSAEFLLTGVCNYDTLLLPNDLQNDGLLLAQQLQMKRYDLIICMGQRPNIKDKVHIETTARGKETVLKTTVDCENLARTFMGNGIPAKVSDHAGTSFCNALYLNGLRFIAEKDLNCRLVFVHIPFLKNMREPSLFQQRFLDVISKLEMKGDGCFE